MAGRAGFALGRVATRWKTPRKSKALRLREAAVLVATSTEKSSARQHFRDDTQDDNKAFTEAMEMACLMASESWSLS